MARIRTIKPEFPQSESMGRVSRDARLCFVMIWTIADDSGRLRGNSRMLASLLFPYDDDAPALMDGWLSELEHEGCIVRYMVDGAAYLEISKWLSHQKIDKPTPSKIPPFVEGSRILANPRESSPLDLGPGPGPKDHGRDQEGEGERAKRSQAVACPPDVDPQVWSDWQKLRKAKKAPVTETVLSSATAEAGKAGMSLEAFLRIWCARGSQGLEASWLKPHERAGPPSESFRERDQRAAASRIAEATGGLLGARTTKTGEVIDVAAFRLG